MLKLEIRQAFPEWKTLTCYTDRRLPFLTTTAAASSIATFQVKFGNLKFSSAGCLGVLPTATIDIGGQTQVDISLDLESEGTLKGGTNTPWQEEVGDGTGDEAEAANLAEDRCAERRPPVRAEARRHPGRWPPRPKSNNVTAGPETNQNRDRRAARSSVEGE